MPKFKVLIQTTVTRSFMVTAESEEIARDVALDEACDDEDSGAIEGTESFIYSSSEVGA